MSGCVVDVSKLHQIGVIMFGAGLNHRQAIAAARAQGFVVSVKEDYALIYKR
jgi:hypothetical protein